MYFECPEDKWSDIKPRPIGKEAEDIGAADTNDTISDANSHDKKQLVMQVW
jgi:hypothetical protein